MPVKKPGVLANFENSAHPFLCKLEWSPVSFCNAPERLPFGIFSGVSSGYGAVARFEHEIRQESAGSCPEKSRELTGFFGLC